MDTLFLSCLSKGLIQQLKVKSTSMDNNATGCYHCIIVLLRMIVTQYLGLLLYCQNKVLKYLCYALKIVYGMSIKNCHSMVFKPLFGTGQGSRGSPAIWLLLLLLILNAFDKLEVDGFSFQDPW